MEMLVAADCLGPALLVPAPFFSLMGNTAKLTKSLMASKGFKGGEGECGGGGKEVGRRKKQRWGKGIER